MKHRKTFKETANQKRITTFLEIVISLNILISTVMPFLLVPCVLHPMEPLNIFFRIYFEIQIQAKLEFIPGMLYITFAMFVVSNVVLLYTVVIVLYFITTSTCISGLKLTSLQNVSGNRCQLKTEIFGYLEDEKLVLLYKTQQMLNLLINGYFRSILISFHHLGCHAIVVPLISFTIRFNNIISENGILGYVVVIGAILIVLMILWVQSEICGDLSIRSVEFTNSVKLLVSRNQYVLKVVRSTKVFYLQLAHPFYNISKETFMLFCGEVLSNSVTLLLW